MNVLATFFGPILGWEMTTLVRRSRYIWLRTLFGSILFFILWSKYAENSSYRGNRTQIQILSDFANAFFLSFTFVQLLAILLLTPAYVATSVAIEKQRKTIEYLFATDLRNREIVLGKWLARTMNVFMLLLVGVPILFIASLLGGIDLNRLTILVVMTASCTASTAALAMFISVHSNEVRRALGNTYSALILLLASPLLYFAFVSIADGVAMHTFNYRGFGEDCHQFIARTGIEYVVQSWHPFIFYFQMFESPWSKPDIGMMFRQAFTMLATHGAITVLLLSLSVLQLRRAWLRSVDGPKKKRRLTMPKNISPFASRRMRALGDRPMLWKEWFFGEQRRVGCASRIILIVGVIAFYFPILQMMFESIFVSRYNRTWQPEGINYYLRATGAILLALAYGKTAIRAASSIGVERDRDCWISLISTPLTASEMVIGKFVGSMKPFFFILAIMFPMWLLATAMGALSILAIPTMLIVFSTYAVFVAGLGVYQSIRRATTGKAIGFTMAICIFLSGLGHMLLSVVLMPLVYFGVRDETVATLYFSSIPWLPIVFSMFRNEDLRSFDNRFFASAIPSAIFWLVVYGSIGALLVRSAIRHFHQTTGRMEDNVAGSTPFAMPPALPVVEA